MSLKIRGSIYCWHGEDTYSAAMTLVNFYNMDKDAASYMIDKFFEGFRDRHGYGTYPEIVLIGVRKLVSDDYRFDYIYDDVTYSGKDGIVV